VRRGQKGMLLAALAVLLLSGVGFLYYSGFFAACSSQSELQAYIQRTSPYGHLVFFLIQLLSVILAPIPSNITAAAGGAIFGAWWAFLLTFLAVVIGSCLVFLLARGLGQTFVDRTVGEKLSEKYRDMIQRKTDTFLLLAFLFPYFPDDVLCVLAGLTKISFGRFLVIMVVARPWGLLFASVLGGTSFSLPLGWLILLGVAGVLLFCAGMKYGERMGNWLMKCLDKKVKQ